MNEAALRKQVRELLKDQALAVLATDRSGDPYASLVGFLSSDDLRHIYFVTTRATRKFEALTSNPRVAMLIDNRSNRFRDFREAMAASVTGEAQEIDKEQHKDIVEAYLEKHPHLAEFIESPTSALLRVSVSTYYVVTRFQHVMELHVK